MPLPIFDIVGAIAVLIGLSGLYLVQPNTARVLVLQGQYVGTDRRGGVRWTLPHFMTQETASLRVRNFGNSKSRVNDLRRNPLAPFVFARQVGLMPHAAPLVALPYYSGAGHTAQLAQAIARGATAQGATAAAINVEEMTTESWATLDSAHAILFGAPTYMGSAAARYGAFLEEAGERWMDLGWKDKMAGGFTVATFPSGDKLSTLQRFSIFAAQMGMIWIGPAEIGAPVYPEREGANADGAWLGLMATSARSPRGAVRSGDLETAARFGARVAGLAKRMS